MTESVHILAAGGLGMVLAGILLGLGLFVGYRAARNAAQPPRSSGRGFRGNARLRAELRNCMKLAQHLARQAEQMTILSSSGTSDSSRRILAGSTDLLEQSAALCQRLERLVRGPQGKRTCQTQSAPPAGALRQGDPQPNQPRNPSTALSQDDRRSRLSAHELGQITESEHHQAASVEDLDRKHYPYDCVQTIIPWSPDDTLQPALENGISIRCHDISGKGISFFWPTPPQFEHFIISLGNDHDLLFMAAQVMRFVPAELDGAAMYLVGCQFNRRMDALTAQWKQQLSRREELELAETL